MVSMVAEAAAVPERVPAGERRRARWWHRGPFVRREVRLSVGTVLVFLFVFYVALPLLASHRSQVGALAHINVAYLALGVLLEIAALVAYAQLTYSVLPRGGPTRFRLFRINLSTLALSHVSPGGTAPGAALGYRLMTQSGVTGADTGFALGTQGIGSAVVLNAIFWCSLVGFLVTHGFQVPNVHGHGSTSTSASASILVMVAAAVGVVLLGIFGGLFYLLTRGQERARSIIHGVSAHIRFLDADRFTSLLERLARRFAVLMEDKALLARAVAWAAANWLLDAASLWVFVAAFGHVISPVDLLMAYGLAYILAAIPITPGGLGVVEFVLVTMLAAFGLTDGQALSAVLAYRAVNFWLPIPFGGLAYASLELEHRSVRHRVWKRALGLQVRTGQVLATLFDRHGPVDAATSADAPPESSPAAPASEADRSSTSPAAPPAVPTYRPAPPPPAAAARPGPHLGDAVGLRAPALGTDPGG
jgi:uncharacterized protein (TIRG00374 family)